MKTFDRRRAAKECTRCGRKDSRTLTGKCYCIRCTKVRNSYAKTMRDMRKENGLCVRCGYPLPENSEFLVCFRCRLKQSEYEAKKRKTAKRGNA